MIRLTSLAFAPGEMIPAKYTSDGKNINPPIDILNAPDDAETLVLTINDPDAPLGDWTHWLVWNIDPGTETIKENAVPKGAVEGTTSFGKPGYSGPCPPDGTHRYYFRVYALDTTITLPPSATVNELQAAMIGHILSQGELLGRYTNTKTETVAAFE